MSLKPALAALFLGVCPVVTACSAQPAPLPVVERPAGPALPLPDEPALDPDLSGDPIATANEAVRRKDWRLYRGLTTRAVGLRCYTPDGTPPGLLPMSLPLMDMIPQDVARKMAREEAYAASYNRVIVDALDFPDADLCRPLLPGEREGGYVLTPLSVAARAVTRPPLSLHEAVRRGTIADLRRFLSITRRNQLDRSGMTPLAWAAVRGRSEIWAELVRNGEEPASTADREHRDDLYWAIASGREEIVGAIIAHTHSQIRRPLPGQWLAAAVATGNPRLVDMVFALPHTDLRWSVPDVSDWQAPAVEAGLRNAGARMAQRVLEQAIQSRRIRPDLMRLALRYGAQVDINAERAEAVYDPPLYVAATRDNVDAPEAVRILLVAGANPNQPSRFLPQYPLGAAANWMRLSEDPARYRQAKAIAEALLAAGARTDLPGLDGKPLVWTVLTAGGNTVDRISASSHSPETLSLFAAKGMDVNATWRGMRVLAAVERQVGPSHPIAATLRALGARL